MARFLQVLIKAKEPIFSQGIARLEKTTGNGGVDVKLIADVTSRAHGVMRRLGLDLRDTTGEELYYALLSSVGRGEAEELLSGAEYVLVEKGGHVISLNAVDVIENAHHQLPYGRHISSSGQRKLRQEIVTRYKSHPRTDEVTIMEIADHMGLIPESDAWYNY